MANHPHRNRGGARIVREHATSPYQGKIRQTYVNPATRYVIVDWVGSIISEHSSLDALQAAMCRYIDKNGAREQEAAYKFVDGLGWTLA
jgi:hypothetical protein